MSNINTLDEKSFRDKEFKNNTRASHDMSEESGHIDKCHQVDVGKTGFNHKFKDKWDIISHIMNVQQGSIEGLQLKAKIIP